MTQNLPDTEVLETVTTLFDALLTGADIVDLLTQLTEKSAILLDVGAAGLLLADPLQRLRLIAATSGAARDLELLQMQADEGPCVESFRSGEPVSVPDLAASVDRWPDFVPAALDAGFGSVHSVAMSAAGVVTGTIGFFGSPGRRFDSADHLMGQTMAQIASFALLQENAPTKTMVFGQLRSALADRTVIEQAKGFVRSALGVSLDEAFTMLRTHCRRHDERLVDVARRLMTDRYYRPTLLAALAAQNRRR